MSCDYKKELAFDYFSFSSPFFSIQFINSKMVLLYHDIIHQLLAFPPIVPPICYWTAQWPKCPLCPKTILEFCLLKIQISASIYNTFAKTLDLPFPTKIPLLLVEWTRWTIFCLFRIIYGQYFKLPAIVYTLNGFFKRSGWRLVT